MTTKPTIEQADTNAVVRNDFGFGSGAHNITSVGGQANADLRVVKATRDIALDISDRYHASLALMTEKAGKYSAEFERFAYAAYNGMNGELPSAPSFSAKPLPTGKAILG